MDYSDGASLEERLLALVGGAADRSLHSAELAAAIEDWPTRCHLDAGRANLLRPLAARLTGRTLEIGAGCGVLTRYLGELGGPVVAVEGSRLRARIAAARCLDLPNVAVVHDVAEHFEADTPFSTVTLVGVLEWATRFGAGTDGARRLLDRLAGLLAPDGTLIVAIENQLGLKYLAGWPEDHLGEAMIGVNDTYRAGEPRTYGLGELTALIASVGLAHQAVFAPLPDYKFPRVVVSPRGLADARWAPSLAGLVSGTPTSDQQSPVWPAFSLERSLALAARNGVLAGVANSFLVVASRTPLVDGDDADVLTWHFSGGRRPAFQVETRFRGTPTGVAIERVAMAPAAMPPSDAPIRQAPAADTFIEGQLWIERLGAIVNRPGWTMAEVAAWSAPWCRALRVEAALPDESLTAVLPARLLDATPFNLAGPDNRLRFFDLEWQPAWPVEYGFVVFRGLFWSLARLRSVATGPLTGQTTVRAVTMDVLHAAGLHVSDADAERYLDLEAALQEQTSGVAAPQARAVLASMMLVPRRPLGELVHVADQYALLRAHATGLEQQRTALEAHARGLEQQRALLARELDAAVAQRDRATVQGDERRVQANRLEEARARLAAHLAQAEAAHRGTADELRAMTGERNRLASDLAIVRTREDEIAAQLRAREQTLRLERRALERTRVETSLAEQQLRRLAAAHARAPTADDASLPGRLRRRLRDAEVPLGLLVRHPARFARGVVRLRHQDYRALVAQLADSGLFDREYYRRAIGAASRVNLVARFLLGGDRAGEPSHPLFDPCWYRARYPDVGSTMPPLRHYLSVGGWEQRAPHPLFDPSYYLAQWPAGSVGTLTPLSHYVQVGARAAASPHPLFDAGHYLRQRPDLAEAGIDPLAHYLAHGAAEGLDPHPLFSTRHYQARYPDIGTANPLVHFVDRGAADGRSPHPLFDTAFYWEQRPDVREHGGNALVHFLAFGGFEGVQPHPLFDTAFYLEQADGLRTLGLNPLVHFLRWGWQDGVWPNRYFDPEWYRSENADLTEVNPLLHFMAHGWREHRAPSPAFSIAGYLAANPDIEQAGVNPLEHFLRHGRAEGRSAIPVVPAPASPEMSDAEALDRLAASVTDAVQFRVLLPWTAGCGPAAEDTLASLHAQRYPRWQVMIVAEASAAADVPEHLHADTRVQIVEDGRTAVAGPPGSALPDDVFVGWLQPGDVLEPHALLLAAHAIDETPQLELVYSDEATRGASGPVAPVHKPDWDPLLQATVDVAGPGTWMRATRVAALLAPADAPVLATAAAVHRAAAVGVARDRARRLPFVLVHTDPSHAYAVRRTAVHTPASGTLETVARTLYGPPAGTAPDLPMVSILVPTRNRADLLASCVASVLKVTRYPHVELIVIDNGSDEADSLALLDELGRQPRCRVLRSPGPFNYSALNNIAANVATGSLLCLMNNDIEVTNPDWLSTLVAVACQPRVGAVGANLHYPDGTLQHAGVILGVHGVAGHAFSGTVPSEPTYMGLAGLPREVSAVTGACLMVAASKYHEVGGLDAASLPVNFSDVDLCLKLRQHGYFNVVLPLTGVIHHESASRGRVEQSPERLSQLGREAHTMLQRWGEMLRHDPYYNPNLSLTSPYEPVVPSRERLPRLWTGPAVATPFTSLGREPRLDIYGEATNDQRVDTVLAPVHTGPAARDLRAGLSVVILNKNAPELLTPLVRQLESQMRAFETAGVGCEVIVGDTGSTNPAILALYGAMPPGMRVVRELQYNFSRCNNQLEELAAFDTVLFLNNDIILPEAGAELFRAYTTLTSQPSIGVLGAVMHYPDATIQHMGCELLRDPGHWGLPYHVHARTRVPADTVPALAGYPAVTGAFLMMGRALFRACGGFDEGYAAECQDTALCLEARRLGYDVACADVGAIVHIENGTRPKGEEHWPDRQRFLRKYGAYIQAVWP